MHRIFAVVFVLAGCSCRSASLGLEPIDGGAPVFRVIWPPYLPNAPRETGIRIRRSGRYEELGDRTYRANHRQSGQWITHPYGWTYAYSLTPREMERLRSGMLAANEPALPAEQEASQRDAPSSRWTLTIGDRVIESKVRDMDRLPALARFHQLLLSIHEVVPAQETSHWKVWDRGTIVERDLACSAHETPGFIPLLAYGFNLPNDGELQGPAHGPTKMPSPSTRIIETDWREDGRLVETTIIYGDGRVSTTTAYGAFYADDYLSTFMRDSLLATIEDLDLAKTPNPISCRPRR